MLVDTSVYVGFKPATHFFKISVNHRNRLRVTLSTHRWFFLSKTCPKKLYYS